MNIKYLVATAGVVSLLIGGQAWSQDDPSEATIRLMDRDDAELPDAVTNNISLPDPPSADSAAAATDAITNAEARRIVGHEKAEAALLRVGDLLDTALQNVEEHSRSDVPADPPAGPPDPLPGTP